MTFRSGARVAAPIAAAIVLPLTAVTLFTPFYQTNDDVGMRLLAEGHFVPGGAPTPFLMFINVVVGKLLTMMYAIASTVPWYDLVLGASLIAATAALVMVWIGSGSTHETAWAVVLAVFLLLPVFVSVQYTVVALTCAAAGIALMLDPDVRRPHRIFGVALFVLGSLIRFEGAVLMAIEGAVLYVVMIRDRPRLRSIVAAVVLTMAFFAIDRFAYSRASGWSEFHEFDRLRTRLNDYITPEQITPRVLARLQSEVGWSSNDFALFVDWCFADPGLYSLEKIRKAAAIFDDEPSLRMRLKSAIEDAGAFLLKLRWVFLLLGVFVLARGAPPRLVIYFLGTTLAIVLLAGATSVLRKTPPPRIYWPMLILGATMLTIAARRYERPPRAWLTAVTIVIAVYLGAPSLAALHRSSEERHADAEVARGAAAELQRSGARLFIVHGNAFPYEDYWQPLHTTTPPFAFIGLGTAQRTPLIQGALRRSASTDVAWSLCSDPKLLLVAWDALPPKLEQSIREHHGTAVHYVPVFRSERVSAWRCNRSP